MRKIVAFVFVSLFVITSCKVEDSVSEPEPGPSIFNKIAEYQTDVSEPSGLTIDKSGKFLWTVSDNTNRVYKIDLQGKILKELNYEGDDLEGVTFDASTNTLWIAEERLREVVNIDTNGNELSRHKVLNFEGDGNSGLEGICFEENSAAISVLNEKNPELYAKLDSNFSATNIKQISAVDDLSGIFPYENNSFLIVSDESKKLIIWHPQNGVIAGYDLDYPKAEGVAYDFQKNLLYIVSDKTGKLYVYKKR